MALSDTLRKVGVYFGLAEDRETYYDDDDPFDVLVVTNLPTFTGCIVEARPMSRRKRWAVTRGEKRAK
jgi:inorganic pyrophosphatase